MSDGPVEMNQTGENQESLREGRVAKGRNLRI